LKVQSRPKKYIACVIANDAADGDDVREKYTGVGPNYRRRMKSAVLWVHEHLPTANVTWAFGAGTDEAHARGPALAIHCMKCLKDFERNPNWMANTYDKNFFGTFEEIAWIVRRVGNEPSSMGDVQFVFFTQARHIWRVKLIWRLFYQKTWGRARFVVTDHIAHIPLWHEAKGIGKVLALYIGAIEPQYTKPYPSKS
jgi:hypothetical protein